MATIVKRGPRWRAQVRRIGHNTLSKTFAARADAMAWARDIEGKIDKGQSVEPGRRITFAELMTAYREQLLASKGIGRSKAQALDKLMKLLGPRRLVELKTTAFLEFCRARENEGAGPATILQDLTHIGTVLRHGGALIGAEHAVETCITALDAARRTLRHSGRVANPEERDRRPTDDELAKLIAYWSPNPRQTIPMIDLTLFAVATAMRLGEIVGLQWENLDEANRTIVIRERKHPTKKATNHQKVPLPFGTCTVGGQLIDPLQIMLKQPSAWARKAGYSRTPRKACLARSNVPRMTLALWICASMIFATTARRGSLKPDGRSNRLPLSPAIAIGICFADTLSLEPKILIAGRRTLRPAARWFRSARTAPRDTHRGRCHSGGRREIPGEYFNG